MPPKPLTYQSEIPRAESLQQLLPTFLSNLSLGRAQIAIDQIRSALQNPRAGQLVMVTATTPREECVAAAVAVVTGDTATIVHAGPIDVTKSKSISTSESVMPQLSRSLDEELRRRSVTFVQWAADPSEVDPTTTASTENLALPLADFDMQSIARLDYLSGAIDTETIAKLSDRKERPALKFIALKWPHEIDEKQELDKKPQGWPSFVETVQRTYSGTQDCPRLGEFRTAEQTLDGYRVSDAFDPRFWFTAIERDSGHTLGCLILATHIAKAKSNEQPTSQPVIEIVYMGLVPDARGLGLAPALVAQAMESAMAIGGDRLILAVDQKNHAAGRLYRRAAMSPMMSEEVWCKSVPKNQSSDDLEA